ncbi:hypothetical protein LCGC14_1107250 [marine sediment metagenome]|uniref:Uncharacterized protein n=1 Tax=marine sediment metagenome TaxID=412755 RepID=A0A0F9QE05_9ZZZZ
MKKYKRRAYAADFDFWGVGALGDVEYEDGFDKWDDIKEVFKNIKEEGRKVPVLRSHGDVRTVGHVGYHELDKCNKKVYIGFNQDELEKDIKLDALNGVSVEWITDNDNKIIDISHWAIGNTFKPMCEKDKCNIMQTKQRGDEPDTEVDPVTVPDEKEKVVPAEPEGSEQVEEISNTILMEEMKLLKKQIESMSKAKEEPKTDPEGKVDEDKKLKLGFQEKLKHELPGEESTKRPNTGFTKWKFV